MRMSLKGLGLLLAGLVLSLPTAGFAQQHPNLDGTWKLATPQNELLPTGSAKVPLTADGLKLYQGNKKSAAKGDFSFDQTRDICSAPGLPRLMIMPGRFQIFTRGTVVTMSFEWNHLFRQVEMRDVPPKKLEVDTMNGVSFGHWEGDTLVVKSLSFLPEKLIDDRVMASDTLELVERLRLTDNDTLEDRVTITDPATFTRPWETVLTYKRQADVSFAEDSCLDRRIAKRPFAER